MPVVFVCCEVNRFVHLPMSGVPNCSGDSCVIAHLETEVVPPLKHFTAPPTVAICAKSTARVESEKYFSGLSAIV